MQLTHQSTDSRYMGLIIETTLGNKNLRNVVDVEKCGVIIAWIDQGTKVLRNVWHWSLVLEVDWMISICLAL